MNPDIAKPLPLISAGIGRFFLALAMVSALMLNVVPVAAQEEEERIERPKAVDLLPERTSVYVQIDNFQQLVSDLSDSNFGRMLADEKIAPLVEELYGEAKAAFDELDTEEELGFSLSELSSLPTGEICFAVVTPRRKKPQFVLIMDVSEDGDLTERLIDRGRREAEDEDAEIEGLEFEGVKYEVIRGGGEDENVHFVVHQGTFIASNNQDLFEELMTRWLGTPEKPVKSLRDNRKFVTIMNKCKSTEELPMAASFFVDPIMLAKSITVDVPAAGIAFAALPTLGLDGVSAIGGSMLFDEQNYESILHGHLLLADPRAGIIEMIALRPGFYDPEPMVSNQSITYATSSWDFRKFVSELTTIVDTFTSEGYFEQQIEENINEELGINFQEDVLENLKGRISWLQWVGEEPTFDGQCNGMIIELEDEDRAREFIESFLARIEEEADEEELPVEDDHKGVTFWHAPRSFEAQGRQARERWRERRRDMGEEVREDSDEGRTRIAAVETVPCFAIIDGYFVFCGNIDFMKHMIETNNGDHELLADSDEYKSMIREMRTLLGDDLPAVFSYSRPAEALRSFYDALLTENTRDYLFEQAEDSRFFEVLSDLVEDNEMPDFDDLAKYFPPQGSFVVNDETGFHFLIFQRRAELDDE